MPINNSPNMSLPIPSVGQEPGPQYATDINNCLTIVDMHNHNPGSGVQVTTSGLNINADLSFNDNNLILVQSARFQPQGSPLGGPSDLGCLYESGVDLYYNDGNGNQIRITAGGSITGTAGSISGLVPPASASYNTGSGTFIWQSGANIPANMDFASAIFRNMTAGSNGVTVSAPAALGSNYSLVWPTIPGTPNFVSLDTSGNFAAIWNVDNTTINFSGNNIQVKPGSITTTQISPTANIVGTQLSASANILGSQLDPAAAIEINQLAAMPASQVAGLNGFALSPSCGTFSVGHTGGDVTNLNITLTTSGRPMMIGVRPLQGNTGTSVIAASMTNPNPATFMIQFVDTPTGLVVYNSFVWTIQNTIDPSLFTTFFSTDISTVLNLSAGTYPIKVVTSGTLGINGIGFTDIEFYAYEI